MNDDPSVSERGDAANIEIRRDLWNLSRCRIKIDFV